MSADPEEERRSILASTAHRQEDLELSASDREAAERRCLRHPRREG